MDKVYGQAKDKYVRHYTIYAKTGTTDNKAYIDSALTIQMKTSELKEAVLKGAMVAVGTDLYAVTSYSESAGVGTAIILTVGGSDAATLRKLTSAADA